MKQLTHLRSGILQIYFWSDSEVTAVSTEGHPATTNPLPLESLFGLPSFIPFQFQDFFMVVDMPSIVLRRLKIYAMKAPVRGPVCSLGQGTILDCSRE